MEGGRKHGGGLRGGEVKVSKASKYMMEGDLLEGLVREG